MAPPVTLAALASGRKGTAAESQKMAGFLLFSEMQNDRIRVYDIQEGAFISEPQTHPTLYAPHGLYPNPSGTHAATPQYWFDHHTVGIRWTA